MSTRSSWRPAIALFKVAKVHAAKLKMQRNKSLATIKGHKILSHTHTATQTTHTHGNIHMLLLVKDIHTDAGKSLPLWAAKLQRAQFERCGRAGQTWRQAGRAG